MSNTLSAHKLTLVRGERCLFKGLNFALGSGELLLLEGRNGSGKTSLLKAIIGLLELETGEFQWNGMPVRSQRQEFLSASVWMAHRVGMKPDLTASENLSFESTLRPLNNCDIEEALERLGVLRLKKLPLRSLSAGQQRRVGLARMLIARATLWLMDEPFTNLDREGRDLLTGIISDHIEAGGLCVLAAHQDVAVDVPTQRILLE
ncbi:MAG TPA: cytochrome c biogenesis heme-transporting ATPase CcmA [Woeseiaceae bacterium]|nr:cytochrome c biogenesis heme-transporting ATPase CcmA [Woeseiaceae bacterium]